MTGKEWICRGLGIFLGVLCLTACSGKPGAASQEKVWYPEYVATINQVDFQDRVTREVYLCNEELICETWMMDGRSFYMQEYYTIPLSQPGAVPEKFSLQFSGGLTSVYDMAKDDQGNYYTLESDRDYIAAENEGVITQGFCVCTYDAEGMRREKWGITEWLLEAGGQVMAYRLALDGQGNIYVLGPEILLLIDSTGHYRGCIQERIWNMICGADGQIYYINYGSIDHPLKKIDFESGKSEHVRSNFPQGNLFRGENEELWVFNQIGVYRSREGETAPELILNWLDVDIDGAGVREMALLPDGQFLVIMLDTNNWNIQTAEEAQPLELAHLARTEGENAGRKLIDMAVISISEDLRLATLQYNREHPDYRVVLREYAGIDGQRSVSQAVAAIDLDLVSGREPDILSVDYFDLEKYTSKGLLVDLGQYLDKSDRLHREDLVEAVVNAYTMDGKLVALPTWFRMETIIGKKSMLGEGDHWSIEDMAAFFDKYQDPQVWQSASPESMLEICMKFNQSYFVDWEKGSCNFDTEEFYRLLEFAGRFSGDQEFGGWNRIRQEDGQALLWIKWCARVDFVSEMPQWFSGEEVSYIGYPVLDGKPGIMLETSADSYGILSTSAYKEQAWDYLEYVILAKGGSDRYFSVLRDGLDRMLKESTADPYEVNEAGEARLDGEGKPIRRYTGINTYIGVDLDDLVVYDYVPLPEEVEQVKELVNLARPAPGYHEVIENIILEEAAGYFAGDKGAEEAAALIQNRVQLYLDEQK